LPVNKQISYFLFSLQLLLITITGSNLLGYTSQRRCMPTLWWKWIL